MTGTVVVLAEKPSAARNFAKALGGPRGTFEGREYEVVALRGHILELLPPPEQVGDEKAERYRVWSLEALPWDMRDMAWRKGPRGDVAGVVGRLREACEGAAEVAIATDVDPSGEGELLAWEALELVGWRGRTTRMYFADEAVSSIQKAFRERRPIASMEEDGDWAKAWCRQRWDFMSMQLTRVASCVAREQGFRTVVRQGRLKSVMVWLVGEQQKAYESYKRVPFFEARFRDENGVTYAVPEEDAERFATAEEVDLSRLHESDVVCDSRTMKHKAPGRLLDLAGLSAILATKGSKPKEILDTYQRMYEDQIVSYPRTEDKQVTPEQFAELLPLVDDIARLVAVDPALLTHRAPRATHVREGGAHGANRPGPNVPSSLGDLRRYGPSGPAIYDTLARNYLAMLAEDYEYEQVIGHVRDFTSFVGKASVPVRQGFRAVFDAEEAGRDGEEDEGEPRDLGRRASPFVHEGANRRPQRPTQKWLKARLEKHNVGTGATRVSTLAEISAEDSETSLLSNSRGVLSLTDCGRVSHALLEGCEIASPEATEALFSAMEEVGRFERDGDEVVSGIDRLVAHDLAAMRRNAGKVAALGLKTGGPAAVGRCPRCGEDVVKARSGKLYYCSSRKFRKGDSGRWEVASEGCGFRFMAKVCGKPLTDGQASALLAGKTVRMSGLRSADGKRTFSAGVRVNADKEWGTELVFDDGGGRPKARRAPRGRRGQ